MKNYKIKIENENQFNEVVELAGKLGYKKPNFTYQSINNNLFLKHNGMFHTGTFEPETYQEITIDQLRTLADPKSLIGRKVKGFRFEDGKYNGLRYHTPMSFYVGLVGEIKSFFETDDSYLIEFNNEVDYLYPQELTHKHLIEEEPDLKKVWAWDDNPEDAFKTYFIREFPDFEFKYQCIHAMDVEAYKQKKCFNAILYKNISETDPRINDVLKIVEKYGKDKLITLIEKL